jgi:cholesterol transport system auxiliary component
MHNAAPESDMSPSGRIRLAALGALALLATACISVDIGKDTAQQAQFRIVDSAATPAAAARSSGRDLVVAPQPSSSVDDSFSLAFSRQPNQRAAYQFATWSDRPSNRLAQLLVDRLGARRSFASVTLAGRGVAGDVQLNLSVNDFYHDASATPGAARVEIAAELIDRSSRRLIARQTFSASAPVSAANAAAAAAALGVASTKVLDDLVAWIEARTAPSTLARTN